MELKKGYTIYLFLFPFIVFVGYIYPYLPGFKRGLCAFRYLWSYGCPGCGLTRSVSSFIHGHISASLEYNPLGPFVLFLLFAAWGDTLFLSFKGRSLLLFNVRLVSFLTGIIVISLFLQWFYKIITNII